MKDDLLIEIKVDEMSWFKDHIEYSNSPLPGTDYSLFYRYLFQSFTQKIKELLYTKGYSPFHQGNAGIFIVGPNEIISRLG